MALTCFCLQKHQLSSWSCLLPPSSPENSLPPGVLPYDQNLFPLNTKRETEGSCCEGRPSAVFTKLQKGWAVKYSTQDKNPPTQGSDTGDTIISLPLQLMFTHKIVYLIFAVTCRLSGTNLNQSELKPQMHI